MIQRPLAWRATILWKNVRAAFGYVRSVALWLIMPCRLVEPQWSYERRELERLGIAPWTPLTQDDRLYLMWKKQRDEIPNVE